MALKHLRQVEQFLKKHRKRDVARTEIRDSLGVNYNAVLEALDYLAERKQVKITKEGKYKWSG